MPFQRYLIDSGAYSVKGAEEKERKTLKHVTVSDYCRWLDELLSSDSKPYISGYITLDKIGSPDTTWKNYLEMVQSGFSPIPIYHAAAPMEYLERYVENELPKNPEGPTLCYGLPRGESHKVHMVKIGKFWNRLCVLDPQRRIKVHALGSMRQEYMFGFPWYSMDATSWRFPARYGKVIVPRRESDDLGWPGAKVARSQWRYDQKPRSLAVDGTGWAKIGQLGRAEIVRYLRQKGYTLEEVREDRRKLDAVNMIFYVDSTRHARNEFKRLGRVVTLYLAGGVDFLDYPARESWLAETMEAHTQRIRGGASYGRLVSYGTHPEYFRKLAKPIF